MISRCNKFVKSSTGPWRILQGPALTMKGNMKDFTIKQLVKYLLTIEDQNLPVRVCLDTEEYDKDANYWLHNIEVNNTGTGGYEQSGEIRLIGSE